MKGDGESSQGSLVKIRIVNQPGWPGREGGLALGLMGPELGVLVSSGWREGQASRRIMVAVVTVQAGFGVEEGTPRCDCIYSLALILTLPLSGIVLSHTSTVAAIYAL